MVPAHSRPAPSTAASLPRTPSRSRYTALRRMSTHSSVDVDVSHVGPSPSVASPRTATSITSHTLGVVPDALDQQPAYSRLGGYPSRTVGAWQARQPGAPAAAAAGRRGHRRLHRAA